MFEYLSKTKNLYIVLLSAFALLYYYFSCSYIGFGDALGFVWSFEMGFEHHTNANAHFAYGNLMRLLYLVLPWFSAFQIASLVSIVFALFTLLLLYKIVWFQTQNTLAASLAMLAFGLSFTFWRQTEIVEVYTMNLAFVALILYLIILAIQSKNPKYNYWIAILFGFTLLIHIQNILIIPAIVFAFYHSNHHSNHTNKLLKTFLQLCPSLIFSSLLLIIPLATGSNTLEPILYEDSGTISKFIDHDFKYYIISPIKHLGYLFYNFHVLVLVIIYAMFLMYKTKRIIFLFLIGFGLPYFLFSLMLDVPDSYVFALVFYLVCAVFLGYGIGFIIESKPKIATFILCVLVLFAPIFYFSSAKIAGSIASLDSLKASKAYKGGLTYLLWPGMRNNVDVLELSQQIELLAPKPHYFDEMEWNYNQAIKYKKWEKYKAQARTF